MLPVLAESVYGNHQTDSMQLILHSSQSDTQKVQTMLGLAKFYLKNGNLTLYEKHLEQSYQKSVSVGYRKGEADVLMQKGKFELVRRNRLDRATLFFVKSLAIYESINDLHGIAGANLQLGVISYDLQSYADAIPYFKKILTLKQQSGNTIATANYLMALSYSELDSFQIALTYFNKALFHYKSINQPSGVLWCREFIGKMMINNHEYDKAIIHLREITDHPEILKDSSTALPAYTFLSTAYLQVGDYRNAILFGNLAYHFGNNSEGGNFYLKEALNSLHAAYKNIGKIKEAYYFLERLNNLKDSIYSNNILQRTGKIKSQFEYEQQLQLKKIEQEKRDIITQQELKKQKILRNGFLLGFTTVLLFAGIFLSQRNKIKKGKKLSDDLLLNILPTEVAEELKKKGNAEARLFEQATVMFTDFKNFTGISEKLTPAELVAEIHTCFTAFDTIIDKYGIEKIKTIGDAYMCASGLPVPSKSHATNMVNAALEIQDFMNEHLQKRKQEGKELFEIRIGIHCGPVVAGIVGIKKFAYDIWGDTVNIASRMESSGEAGKVNISDSCYALVKNEFNCTYRGMIKAKNKGEIDMYFVNRS